MRKNIENRNRYSKYDIATYYIDDGILEKLGLMGVELPDGYCIIGGAARSVAFAVLHPQKTPPPIRDLDVGYIVDQNPDMSLYDEISAKYMADDYTFGHGAQEIGDIESYMNSRDFTMNQVILQGNRLTITRRAVDDIKRGIIRFAEYGDNWYPDHERDNKYVSDRLMMKAQLQRAVLEREGYTVRVDPEARVRQSNDYFHLALFIQKAFEYGDDVPEDFVDNLRKAGIFGDEIEGSMPDIMDRINNELLNWPFDWRNEAAKFLQHGDGWLDVSDEVWEEEVDEIEEELKEEVERIRHASRGMSGVVKLLLERELAKH